MWLSINIYHIKGVFQIISHSVFFRDIVFRLCLSIAVNCKRLGGNKSRKENRKKYKVFRHKDTREKEEVGGLW